MEDLFGHNRKPIMPRTREIEEHMYRGIPSDAEDYRGIKDMDFSLEDFAMGLEQGYLKSNSSFMNLFGSTVPKVDTYFIEEIDSQWRRLNTIGLDDLQILHDLDAETFEKAACNVRGSVTRVTPNTFYMFRDATTAVERLSDGIMDDMLEAISQVCHSDFEPEKAANRFIEQAQILEGICDEVLLKHQGRYDEVVCLEDGTERLNMVQTDFDMCVTLLTEYLPRNNNLDKDILNIACKLQNITAHCIRINKDSEQYKPIGKPSLGKLSRFAADIEKIPSIIGSLMHSMSICCNLMNSILNQTKK